MAKLSTVETTEMHTGGEPLRIIEKGYPEIKGNTILEKIRYLRENLDMYRKFLMWEPRGHYDMYGVLLVTPDIESADFGTIFLHNEGYSSMCGHAVIALGRYAVDKGLVKNPQTPETKINIQCPCGLVEAYVEYDGVKTENVRFRSVPSFVYATDVDVAVEGYGTVQVDVVYGGAFYALVPAERYGLKVRESSVEELRRAAGNTTDSLRRSYKVEHPESPDLEFIYGTIMTDGKDEFSDDPTANMCVFAEREVDRSPCGSGVTARTALQYFKGHRKIGQKRRFRGPSGAMFTTSVVKEVTYGKYKNAVVVEVSGKGHYSGSSKFTLEDDDEIGQGFILT
ncbi:hypothetical protein FSP39_008076 [Pinctada imbricata]|uniref:trans-L-3-hydroxyproline dehydratase n=1 Tax=Pinctada imbricata TaxID=66713 RepID=A0AA88Y5E7_PINIB|nr:hypothetical protein FSP39_008076 [Pinctada imbricata]